MFQEKWDSLVPITNSFHKFVQTCLIFDRLLNCGSSLRYLSAFSPPSPVLDFPPILFIAMARLVWASMEMLPKLIAPGIIEIQPGHTSK